MEERKVKTPSESMAESTYIMMPQYANDAGIAFGGSIVAWIDIVAAIVARRHCEREVVTVSIDGLSFIEPINIGEHVILKASMNYVGRTSMEVGVKVLRELPYEKKIHVATRAYLTFVALDEERRPVQVPLLRPETEIEKRRYENARRRMEARFELREKIAQANKDFKSE